MTSSDRAVTIGMSGGVTIGDDAGRRTKRAATTSSAMREANPIRPAASDAAHMRGDNLLARRFCRRVAAEAVAPQRPPMNRQYAHKYRAVGKMAHGTAVASWRFQARSKLNGILPASNNRTPIPIAVRIVPIAPPLIDSEFTPC